MKTEVDTRVKLTDENNVRSDLTFEKGYWSFDDIRKKLGNKDIDLGENKHNEACRVHSKKYTVNLGELGLLLGFERGKVIPRNTTTVSNRVNINKGLRYIIISCDLVDNEKVTNRFGEPSKTICILPIDTSQRLNGTFTRLMIYFPVCP